VQIPIGLEATLTGVVDLVEMRAFSYEGERGYGTLPRAGTDWQMTRETHNSVHGVQ
jgi:hypothetical protein